MPPAGFQAAIPASERPQTHALDGAAIGTGLSKFCKLHSLIHNDTSLNSLSLTDVLQDPQYQNGSKKTTPRLWFYCLNIIQGVPHPTEPGISLIIITPIKILQRNLNRGTFVVWEMKRNVSVVCVCSAPNCCSGAAVRQLAGFGSEWDTLYNEKHKPKTGRRKRAINTPDNVLYQHTTTKHNLHPSNNSEAQTHE
jgi:hypothetical protein